MTRAKTSLLLALAALVLAPGAAASVEIRGLDTSGYPTVRLTAVSSRPVSVKPALAENGHPVVALEAQNLGQAKAVELVLDRSRSMSGSSLADALAAARTFVSLKTPGDRLGLIAFGQSAGEQAALSDTSADLSAELDSMRVDSSQGTALYAAVIQAAHALRSDALAGRVIVLLTDGRNVAGGTTLEDAVNAARKAGAVVYAVGTKGPQFDPAPLMELASETGGHYVLATSSARLSAIYAAIASELGRSWRLSYVTSVRPGEMVSLQASLVGAGTATTHLRIAGSSSGAAHTFLPSFAFSTAGTILVALLVGLIGLAALGTVASARKHSWVQARLEPHLGQSSQKKGVGTRERLSAVAALFRITENVLGSLNVWRRLTLMLERADVPLRTVELVWTILGLGLGLGLLVSLTGAGSIAVLVAMLIGGALPYGFVWLKMKRRLEAFETQLPDLLVTMAASLKAGHSFKQGLKAAMEEGQEPAAGEFRRVLTQTSLGRPMDEALKEMSERLGSANFEFVITAVTIQRQVGGSLAQLFDMVADTVRQRQQFVRKVRSLTAMGKMSAYVLVGLPFFLAAMLTLINASYMAPLYHTSTGNLLLGIGIGSIAVGSLMLRKIVSFKG
ncbi:MAG: VWA domain-containing protein [Gaiellaceae bacterium]